MPEKVLIIGAGLCGTLHAIRMAERGHQVILTEKRSDIREADTYEGRSINLALSDRGFRGLRLAGMEEEVRGQCIPMYGRRIHPLDGEEFTSPYSGREGKYINSVYRGGLNITLLNKAETYPNLELHFDTSCQGVNYRTGVTDFTNDVTEEKFKFKADYIFGTDGSNSAVRRSMQAISHRLVFSYSLSYLSHAYKELTIPPAKAGGYRIEKNALHIWPRGGFMLIALPNLDGSFTVTLFLANKGEKSFEQLNSEEAVLKFFESEFPDVVPHMPDLLKDFSRNPTSLLATIKCGPWSAGDKVLLMGDAAHAIVPFYGQGMNASFEDVVVFDALLDEVEGDIGRAISTYSSVRKADADAIADLAIDNFHEMRDHVANPVFQRKRQLEMKLEEMYPDYLSKYSMVTFNENIPYEQAMRKGRAQDERLMEVCSGIESVEDLILEQVYQELKTIVY
jgi:kynurenine 3-monooxygenase